MQWHQSNRMLLESLDERVYGHTEAKKALIVMLSRIRMRNHQKYIKFMDDDYLVKPMKLLLVGSSGSGKTHLLNSLQSCEYFPLVKLDATHLNPSGGSGGMSPKDVSKMIMDEARFQAGLYASQWPTVQHALDNTVVFIDEIDKLGYSFESSGNWNRHVQSNFLTLIDNHEEFSGISFVFAGAFTSITSATTKHTLGFNKQSGDNKEPLDDKIIKAGLIPEIVGRINYIVELDKFTKDDYYHILTTVVWPQKLVSLATFGIFDIELSNNDIDNIVEMAIKSEQGVRFLHRAVDKLFLDAEFNSDGGSSILLQSL